MSLLTIPIRYKRLLRHYRHVAHISHGRCPTCSHEIKPGEEYEGYVYITLKSIRIYKYHVYCPEDFWRGEEKQARDTLERMEKEESLDQDAEAA